MNEVSDFLFWITNCGSSHAMWWRQSSNPGERSTCWGLCFCQCPEGTEISCQQPQWKWMLHLEAQVKASDDCSLADSLTNMRDLHLETPSQVAIGFLIFKTVINTYFRLQLLLLSHFSRVRLCATPETAARQAPPSLGFSRQEHGSGLPFPSPMHESEKWKGSRSVVSDS